MSVSVSMPGFVFGAADHWHCHGASPSNGFHVLAGTGHGICAELVINLGVGSMMEERTWMCKELLNDLFTRRRLLLPEFFMCPLFSNPGYATAVDRFVLI